MDKPPLNTLPQLPLAQLRPSPTQPRKNFPAGPLAELADNIRQHGIRQALLVRGGCNGDFEIIAGERRWRAAKLAKLPTAPALVTDMTDARPIHKWRPMNLSLEITARE